MPDWAANTPWWVVFGLTVTLLLTLFKIARWSASKDNRLGSLEKLVAEIREDIKKIFNRLPAPTSVQANSPVSLSEFGEKISSRLSVRAWAAREALSLVDEARGKEEFEIFDTCVAHVKARLEADEELDKAVRAGAYELGTEPEQIRKVYEVELPDEVLRLIEQAA